MWACVERHNLSGKYQNIYLQNIERLRISSFMALSPLFGLAQFLGKKMHLHWLVDYKRNLCHE
jgi:hypothetical protein